MHSCLKHHAARLKTLQNFCQWWMSCCLTQKINDSWSSQIVGSGMGKWLHDNKRFLCIEQLMGEKTAVSSLPRDSNVMRQAMLCCGASKQRLISQMESRAVIKLFFYDNGVPCRPCLGTLHLVFVGWMDRQTIKNNGSAFIIHGEWWNWGQSWEGLTCLLQTVDDDASRPCHDVA